MATTVFPTMSSGFQSFPEQAIDDTISSPSESGYVQTRPRFTRKRRTFGSIQMTLTRTDRDALIAFDATVRGSVVFTVTHPTTGEVLNVRFKSDGRPKIAPLLSSNPTDRIYSAEFTLEEV